ncbi:hypothetical protein [Spongiactinospora sp. 9N601]|uniref:hypothetical protein n=1 Tax=Spongiactinospora sp. 9N601 TaxID=3375149 RepID=UPI0037A1B39C
MAEPTTTPTTAADRPADVITRFLNLGGSVTELHRTRFTTRWTYSGPPYAAASPYEINGYTWRCLGCAAYGREGDDYNDPGWRKLHEARQDAQDHAAYCRAMPRPVPSPPRRRLIGWRGGRG